jgi:hypothetical protein
MTKPLGGIHPIVMEETLYRLTSYVLCLPFHEAFATHFSPHQFGVATKDSYETIIHDIYAPQTFTPTRLFFSWTWKTLSIQNQKGSYFKNFMQPMGTSYNSSLLFMHFINLTILCFIVIIIVTMMSQSSHLPWGFIKVILQGGHYSF